MSKVKKVLAMILSMAMILGMSLTAFAEKQSDPTSDITVNGLSENISTTVKLVQAVYLDLTDSGTEWKIEDWAKDYIEFNETTKEVTLKPGTAQDLYTAAGNIEMGNGEGIVVREDATISSTITFIGMPVGAYVIVASDDKATYNPLVANNYDKEATSDTAGVKAKDVSVTAKAGSHTITKEIEQDDKFVHRGETVDFEITAIFPGYYNEETGETLESFKITDTPSGLRINRDSVDVIIGETSVKGNVDITYTPDDVNEPTTSMVINFDKLIAADAEAKNNEGQVVKITYSAVVTDDESYNNKINATSDTVEYTPGKDVNGYTGSITITKKDSADQSKILKGAEFKVYPVTTVEGEDVIGEKPLQFVPSADESASEDTTVYKLAESGENGANATIVATNGKVMIKGLDAGKYHFVETKAPNGYSINETGLTVEIVGNDNQVVTVTSDFLDTKLSSLPSTGGMGTTIFTIGGCAIMIAAAGLFFASRKKESK